MCIGPQNGQRCEKTYLLVLVYIPPISINIAEVILESVRVGRGKPLLRQKSFLAYTVSWKAEWALYEMYDIWSVVLCFLL